ncbi:tyrosine-type recombinase/integrase [Alteromonas sp. C1M14]|uniref:tyrosine-type recombinase/integrase n=1 Tax=Alteromonas sp. C1M14 TaxID=2841567 RepID=UPI001C0853DB|nr:tyrosine-type recombinase/integrase [Alteromonas sp. C1M14]MBU2979035.1 tyrosine-type recombinase/integrase [Alteromonas sp. C1M14]
MAEVKSFTKEEERILFSTLRKFRSVESQRDLNWMLFMRYTARRVETVHLMNIEHAMDALESGYLDIESHMQKGGKVGNARGLNKSQKIYLVDGARKALEALLRINRKMKADFAGKAVDDNALILSNQRQRMSKRAYQQRMTHWCNQAGIVKATPHWLRHTWAVRRLQNATNGAALREVQEVLGHRHITTTQMYTQPSRDDMKRTMQEAAL